MAHEINVQLPVQFEDFYILSFGKIIASPLYYGANYIWPIGYKSCWHEKLTGSLFTCEVSNNGQGGPLFKITRSSCSELPLQYGQTILCRADLEEHDNVVTEIDQDIGDEIMYEDVIGDQYFEGSSLSSTWELLLKMIVDVHEKIINRNGGLQCYCRHAEDLSFLSSVHFTQEVSIDLENFLHSQQCVSVPTVVHGDKETREFSKSLINWMRGYRFGLDIEFVQEFIEQLPGVEACSGYILCKDRLRDSSSTISNKKIKIKDVEPFPVASLISSRLSSNATGNLLQVYEFLCRFKEVLEVEEDCLSYEDLENELHLTPWPVTYGYGAGAFLETVEMNCVKNKVDKLTTVHMALLPWLVSKLLRKITKAFKVTGDAKHTEKDKDKKVNLEMFPINPLTWPEVARRYILACLLMGSKNTAVGNKTKLIRCLQGDDAIFSGSPAGVAGSDVDAQLLGRAVEKVFGKRKRERSILPSGTKVDNLENYRFETDFSIPEWAKVLDPVRKLPTNVGSRIRNCVRESLKKNPPEWAKKLLEASISKDVYKGNASGPTKRAVIDVLKRVSDGLQTASPPGMGIEDIKTSKMLSNTVMKKCRVVLRQVAEAYDKKEKVLVDKKKKGLFNLVGRDVNCNDNYLKIVFGSVSMRPIDLRTIDLRLFHGAYGASHEAFLEDVKEVRYFLPDGAKRGSRASSELRSEWCAFVKSANTVYEMVEATMVLETMIKTDYINNTWWCYWSSMAAAAKTSTISALALRIYTLDAAIDYQKTNTTTAATSSSQKLSKKRKHPDDKPNEQRKKPKKPLDKQEIKEQIQNIIP
ncbi:hypothetical protein Lser_V15G20646 [Lactuca serriola]